MRGFWLALGTLAVASCTLPGIDIVSGDAASDVTTTDGNDIADATVDVVDVVDATDNVTADVIDATDASDNGPDVVDVETGTSCATGLTSCGDAGCVDLRSDPSNCGACSNSCGAASTCSAGVCLCNPGFCGSGCSMSTASSWANCGACGHACASTETCRASSCTSMCTAVGVAGCTMQSDCCGGASCRTESLGGALTCCNEAGRACTLGQCCGFMSCTAGTCHCQMATQSCVTQADCCRGLRCDVSHHCN
jgi:hypothetical protein